jgi:hypothetical protein
MGPGGARRQDVSCMVTLTKTQYSSSTSMKQSPIWEVHSASQEILGILWNPKAHHRVHKNLPVLPILSQMHPIHTFPTYFPKIRSNIILPPIIIKTRQKNGCQQMF